MEASILQIARERVVLLDGGMGTELMRSGLPQGDCPELWNIKNPEAIKKIHHDYFNAGSDAVLTNSFGGNRIKLESYSLGEQCYELNIEAARIAHEVKPYGRFVAGSMGPTGKFLEPQGRYTEKEFEEAYAVQAKALSDGKADFLLIETQYDLREALCALKASRDNTNIPVCVTMTFAYTPRGFYTIMGNSVSQFVEKMKEYNVSAIGANCTVNSEEMAELIHEIRKATSLPLIAQANAGKPYINEKSEIIYSQGIEEYVRFVPKIIENGANIIGGCCGTNPDYIKKMAGIIF